MADFDPYRLTVGTQLATALGNGARVSGELRDGFDDALRHVERHIGGRPGVAVLSGFHELDADRQRTAFRTVCSAIGELMAQDGSGTIVREVQDKGYTLGQGRSGRYADTRQGGSLHTDGAEAPPPVPDAFALFCVRPAAAGGALQLVHVADVGERLDDGVAAVLRRPFHFDRRGDERPHEPPTTQKPVLFTEDGATSVTYLRRYIELGHARPDVPDLTAEQVVALDALDTLLESPELTLEDTMAPGELAVIDNKRVLHGRTEFADNGDDSRGRLLYRTWIRRGR